MCALVLKGLSLAHDFWLALGAMWRPLALALVNRCGNREQLTQLESALGGPAQRQAAVTSSAN